MSPFKIGAYPGSTRPVVVNIPGSVVRQSASMDLGTVSMTVDDAEATVRDLQRAIADAEPIVQVELVGSRTSSPVAWSYLDPSGDLDYDDLVVVPFGASNKLEIGRVVGTGRRGYLGPVKTVTAKLVRQEL